MKVFVLRAPTTSTDAWEKFASPCLDIIKQEFPQHEYIDCNSCDDFVEQLEAEPENAIFFATCHGTSDALHMPSGKAYITHEEAAILKRKFCYLLACSAGKTLGPAAVNVGAHGFIGFADKLYCIPNVHEDVQRKALVSGLVHYLNNQKSPAAAKELKKQLSNSARKLAKKSDNLIVVGALMAAAFAVVHT